MYMFPFIILTSLKTTATLETDHLSSYFDDENSSERNDKSHERKYNIGKEVRKCSEGYVD